MLPPFITHLISLLFYYCNYIAVTRCQRAWFSEPLQRITFADNDLLCCCGLSSFNPDIDFYQSKMLEIHNIRSYCLCWNPESDIKILERPANLNMNNIANRSSNIFD